MEQSSDVIVYHIAILATTTTTTATTATTTKWIDIECRAAIASRRLRNAALKPPTGINRGQKKKSNQFANKQTKQTGSSRVTNNPVCYWYWLFWLIGCSSYLAFAKDAPRRVDTFKLTPAWKAPAARNGIDLPSCRVAELPGRPVAKRLVPRDVAFVPGSDVSLPSTPSTAPGGNQTQAPLFQSIPTHFNQ